MNRASRQKLARRFTNTRSGHVDGSIHPRLGDGALNRPLHRLAFGTLRKLLPHSIDKLSTGALRADERSERVDHSDRNAVEQSSPRRFGHELRTRERIIHLLDTVNVDAGVLHLCREIIERRHNAGGEPRCRRERGGLRAGTEGRCSRSRGEGNRRSDCHSGDVVTKHRNSRFWIIPSPGEHFPRRSVLRIGAERIHNLGIILIFLSLLLIVNVVLRRFLRRELPHRYPSRLQVAKLPIQPSMEPSEITSLLRQRRRSVVEALWNRSLCCRGKRSLSVDVLLQALTRSEHALHITDSRTKRVVNASNGLLQSLVTDALRGAEPIGSGRS